MQSVWRLAELLRPICSSLILPVRQAVTSALLPVVATSDKLIITVRTSDTIFVYGL